MTDYERDSEDGDRRKLMLDLEQIVQRLGYDSLEAQAFAWIQEREEVVVRLREICSSYGDNEWPDSANLADVIERHLRHHLDNPRMPT